MICGCLIWFVFVLGLCIGCVFVEFPSILCFDYFDVTMVLLVVGTRADACFSGGWCVGRFRVLVCLLVLICLRF